MIVSKSYVTKVECKNEAIPVDSWWGREYIESHYSKIIMSLSDDCELSFHLKKRQSKRMQDLLKKILNGHKLVIEIRGEKNAFTT